MDETDPPPISRLRFSRETLPGSDPVAAMREYVGREMIRCDIGLEDEEAPFDYAIAMRSTPHAVWCRTYATPISIDRTAPLLRDGNDDLILVLPDSAMSLHHAGGEISIAPGEGFLFSEAREVSVRVRTTGPGWSVRLRHPAVASLLPQLGEAPILSFAAPTEGLALLRRYLATLDAEALSSPALRALAGRHVEELAALVIGASGDFARHIRTGTAAAARLGTIRADMAAHLGHNGLDLVWIARRHGLSPRQVQRLFAGIGTSFSDELRRLRLERARAMLADPRLRQRSVLSIALECGFPEASALNRAFRRHFGVTPSDIRAAAGGH